MKNKLDNFNDTFNNEINIIKQNNNKILTNEIKLSDVIDKNSFLQKNLDAHKDELNNFKNTINSYISEKNQKINDIENNQNNFINEIKSIENNYKKMAEDLSKINNIEHNYKKMAEDLSKINNMDDNYQKTAENLNKINNIEMNYKKIKEELDKINNDFKMIVNSMNDLRNTTNNNQNIRINNDQNQNKEIEELKEKINKLNIDDLLKLDINKINSINEEYEVIMGKNEELFQVLEQHNVTIRDLNTKLTKLRDDYENESKKKI